MNELNEFDLTTNLLLLLIGHVYFILSIGGIIGYLPNTYTLIFIFAAFGLYYITISEVKKEFKFYKLRHNPNTVKIPSLIPERD